MINTQNSNPNIELKVTEELISNNNNNNNNLSNNSQSSTFMNDPFNKINNEIITASYDYTNNYSTNNNEVIHKDTKESKKTNDTKEIKETNDTKDTNDTNNTNDTKDIKENNEDIKEETYIPKLRRTTRTYKYKLGKNKDAKYVGLLIKNRETQKNIRKEVAHLKQQPIQDVKNFLREKNLIKLGSQAPNDVLRKLYEDSMLSGEITNTNANNLVHNYLNDV